MHARRPIQNPSARSGAALANAFTFDPLKMISSGTLVATLPLKHAMQQKKPLKAALQTLPHWSSNRRRRSFPTTCKRKTALHEIACEQDELTRMWALLRPEGN